MITPTSVEPYMLHGVTPIVFSIHSHVRESIGSPVNEMRSRASRRPSASPEPRSMRKTVGASPPEPGPSQRAAPARRGRERPAGRDRAARARVSGGERRREREAPHRTGGEQPTRRKKKGRADKRNAVGNKQGPQRLQKSGCN